MNYLNAYKSFISSQYLYEGLRITTGILIPAFLMAQFNMLSTGILLSLGAMCVSLTDSAGPIHHRRNGMVACLISIFIVTLIVGFAAFSNVVLGLAIFMLCFFFSMLNIYGARAGAVGIASLLILVLSLDNHLPPQEVIVHSLYIAAGGLWYLCFSIILYNVRPYKLAQQALGDCIQNIATYLRYRAGFYDKNVDYTDNYKHLLQQQAIVQDKQNMVGELLFKTRDIVKESTVTGRILVMIYMDIADMFERIMTSYQDYKTLHGYFDGVAILANYHELVLLLANEIEEVGIAISSGASSSSSNLTQTKINETRLGLDALRANFMTPDNMTGMMNLRRILENIEDIYGRVQTLHKYTTYDGSLTKKDVHKVDYGKFITHQEITAEVLVNNLTLKSENFRHSLRVCLAVMIGFIGSLFFPFGHSYWILLTIVVILKPAYSLTKSRNVDRLLGTVMGLIIGVAIVYVVQNKTALLAIMIVLMMGTYVYMRRHYLTSVVLMTPYIIIFFHLLNPATFRSVFTDRLIDTVIGSAIAFGASQFLFPAWEREKIKQALITMLTESINYLKAITCTLTGKEFLDQQQLSRKAAMIALANLSDTFNRMLSEPRSKQAGIKDIHLVVVMCHMLISHLATLSIFIQNKTRANQMPEFNGLSVLLQQYLQKAIATLEGHEVKDDALQIKEVLRITNDEANTLLVKRQLEIKHGLVETETRKQLVEVKSVADQYNFIFNITCDINKKAKALAGVV